MISYSTTLTGDYSSTPTQYTEAGTYTDYYQITKDGYYPAYGPVTVTIEKKDITVTADAKSKTYGDADPAVTYAAPGLISGDTLIGGLARDPGSSVGAYAITLGTLTSASNPNYAITYVGADLTITAKMITPTIILFPTGFAYDGTEKKPAVTVKDGDTGIDPSEYTVAYSNNTNIGDATATITAKADENYAFTETNKTFTITKQGVTPAAAMANYMYDTTPSAPTVSGNTNGGAATVYYSTDSTNVDKEWSGITGTTLNVGTYYMKVHVAATENHAEGSSAVITFKVTPNKNAAPIAPAVHDAAVTIAEADRAKKLEYSMDGTNWVSVPTLKNGAFDLSGLAENVNYTIYLRVKAGVDGNYLASDAVSTNFITPTKFSVAYHANYGTGTVPASVTQNSGSTVTVASCSGLKRTGYTFNGWNTQSGGTGTAYAAGSAISTGAILYAQWTTIHREV